MISPGTVLMVSDNSGAKKVICIRILYTKKKFGNIGDIIKVSVKKNSKKCKVKKGDIYNALIVNTKYGIKRNDGTRIKFDRNSVVLLDKKLDILSTRITSAIPEEFKNTYFFKIVSLAKYVV